MFDDIYSHQQMCLRENTQMLQSGMHFRLNPAYSVILLSQRSNAPYMDKILEDGITLEYQGHDAKRSVDVPNPKTVDQPTITKTGRLTENGKFKEAVETYKLGHQLPELVNAYEKIVDGIWSYKGFFHLLDYRIQHDGQRNVFIFTLRFSDTQDIEIKGQIDLEHTRLIPTEVKREVWKRDKGRCVICGATKNLHFDHDLPFSKGGTSLTAKNIKLMCATHNLQKGARIE